MKDVNAELSEARRAIALLELEFRSMCDKGKTVPLTYDQLGEFMTRYRSTYVSLADATFAKMIAGIADTGVKITGKK